MLIDKKFGDVFNLRILGANIGCWHKGVVSNYVTSSFSRIFIPLDGEGAVISDSKDVLEVVPGEIQFIPAFSKNKYMCYSKELNLIFIHYNLDLLPGYDFFTGSDSLYSLKEIDEITRKLSKILTRRKLVDSMILKSIVYELNAMFVKKFDIDIDYADRIRVYKNMFEYLSKNTNAKTEVKDLALSMNMSVSNFQKVFKQDFAFTPKKLIDRYLMNQITDFMRNDSLTNKEIGYSLGFMDESVFSHYVKRVTGKSPKQYRNQLFI